MKWMYTLTVYMSLMLRLSNPVYKGRDAICLVQTLKIQPAQLSCLGGSGGRVVCLERRTFGAYVVLYMQLTQLHDYLSHIEEAQSNPRSCQPLHAVLTHRQSGDNVHQRAQL